MFCLFKGGGFLFGFFDYLFSVAPIVCVVLYFFFVIICYI